jgi:hypothetical protein
MIITKSHLQFWESKKLTLPSFASGMKKEAPSIHSLINSQTKVKDKYDKHNTMVIIKSAIRQGKLNEMLTKLAANPNTNNNPKRRAASCKKWLNKIEKNKA